MSDGFAVEHPIRIVRAIARLNVGGPARHTVLLTDHLRGRGYDTILVYGRPSEGESEFDGQIDERGLRAEYIPAFGRAIRLLDDVRAFAALVRVVFRERPRILHTHTAKAGTLGRLAGVLYNLVRRRRDRCVLVHTYHGHVLVGYFGRLGSALVRKVERSLARVTDCIVTISPRQQNDIVTRFRIAPANRVRMVPLGLELDELFALPQAPAQAGQGLREAAKFGPSTVVCGYVGRFAPVKDLPLLVSAFARASAQCPELRLLLIGDGECRGALERQIRELGLEGLVSLPGWCLELRDAYASLDIATITSHQEGTPVALIEAMAAGRPIVATDVGGVADVVSHRESGLLISSRSPDDVAAALVELARDAALRRSFGQAGRAAARRFDYRRLVEDMDRLYRELLTA